MFYLALCVIEQNGDDDNPNTLRIPIQIEAIEGPNLTKERTAEQLRRYMPLIIAAQRLRNKP